MIIECAGLPGAGKTTVCNHVAVAHGGKGSVPLIAMRFDSAFLSAAWSIAALCLGARPFRLERLKRDWSLRQTEGCACRQQARRDHQPSQRLRCHAA